MIAVLAVALLVALALFAVLARGATAAPVVNEAKVRAVVADYYHHEEARAEGLRLPASAGATFGPWATHGAACKCNVCR